MATRIIPTTWLIAIAVLVAGAVMPVLVRCGALSNPPRRNMTMKALLAAALFVSAPALADHIEIHTRHEAMVYPVVLVQVDNGSGSGTVIYSGEHDGEVHTYILTNHHVIKGAITVKEEWDPREQRDIRRETRRPVEVLWFDYNDLSRAIGTRGRTAEIVAYDAAGDMALLRTRDRETAVPYVAALPAPDDPLYIFEPVWAVGAGLGKPPFPTGGLLSNLDERIEGRRFILSSAPIIFGNSGGALFHLDTADGRYELIGVPSRVSGTGYGQAVSHMAWSIPMDSVYEFLGANCVGFIAGVDNAESCKNGEPAVEPEALQEPEPAE